MKMSWHEETFPISDRLWEKSIGDRWVHLTKGEQWGTSMFLCWLVSLLYTSCWMNSQIASDLKCHDVHVWLIWRTWSQQTYVAFSIVGGKAMDKAEHDSHFELKKDTQCLPSQMRLGVFLVSCKQKFSEENWLMWQGSISVWILGLITSTPIIYHTSCCHDGMYLFLKCHHISQGIGVHFELCHLLITDPY